ncbi:molybdenum cofactor synthesis 2, partial [Schizopora paradoxa]
SASHSDRLETGNGECVLSYEPLDTQNIIKSVGDDAAGAIAVFIGTTRNSFQGKTVVHLEYQAYSSLAIKTMATILESANTLVGRSEHSVQGTVPALIKCKLHHRLGVVPVGEPSIVIAVSSPHRRESFQACEFILEEVKAKAQIWKREYYEGGNEDAQWKENI